MRYTRATIDLQAIRDNLSTIKKSIVNPDKTNIIAVVKANAYGHGLVPVAKAAVNWGVSHLAVAIPEEGQLLRQAKITAPVIVLGLIPSEDAELCVREKLIVTVSQPEHLEPLILAAKKLGQKACVMLKSDTGMHRIGADQEGVVKLAKVIHANNNLDFYGLFTHFASAGGPDLSYAKLQAEKFQKLVKEMTELSLRPPFVTASASGASFTMPDCQFDLIRAGIAMYGLYPSDFLQQNYSLEPALRLSTNISYLKKLPANTPVGYEMTYNTDKACYIATLPIGYGDGYSRRLSNKAKILVQGEFYPLCGNICMDQMMACLGPETTAKAGDEVVLVGKQGDNSISLEELAEIVGTINYELACAITQRVPRIYINGN